MREGHMFSRILCAGVHPSRYNQGTGASAKLLRHRDSSHMIRGVKRQNNQIFPHFQIRKFFGKWKVQSNSLHKSDEKNKEKEVGLQCV